MDCNQVREQAAAENYVLGRLTEDGLEAYELHYFQCERCFTELESLQAVQRGLHRKRGPILAEPLPELRPWLWWLWVPAAAVAALLLGVFLMQPRSNRPVEIASAPQVARQPVDAAARLHDLSRIDPPLYNSTILRGAGDQARVRFRAAMEYYQKADYARAAEELKMAVKLDPNSPAATFYLGASYLLSGQNAQGVDWLKRTVRMGDTAYREAAQFYLAKAYLRQGQTAAAAAELSKTAGIKGDYEHKSRELLAEVEKIQ
jgi:tetratricopeptide (TPR) repeat protein